MLELERLRRGLAHALVLIVALLLAAGRPGARAQGASPAGQDPPRTSASAPRYEVRAVHDPNGTGRFYLGREIALVMGPGGMAWLERPERAEEEHPDEVVRAMRLREGAVVADLGAGSGYFAFGLAAQVGKTGRVLAVDVQDEMIATLRRRAAELGAANVDVIKGSETDPHLPAKGVDAVLLVDVYHELAYPYEVMTKIREALKPDGKAVFVEYRKEDPSVPIKELHKMSVDQLTREMNAVGLERTQTIESLPWQHIVIFTLRPGHGAQGDGGRPPK